MFGAILLKNNTFQCKIFSIILDKIMVIFFIHSLPKLRDLCLQRCDQVILERCDHMTLYSPRRSCNIFWQCCQNTWCTNVCTMF